MGAPQRLRRSSISNAKEESQNFSMFPFPENFWNHENFGIFVFAIKSYQKHFKIQNLFNKKKSSLTRAFGYLLFLFESYEVIKIYNFHYLRPYDVIVA